MCLGHFKEVTLITYNQRRMTRMIWITNLSISTTATLTVLHPLRGAEGVLSGFARRGDEGGSRDLLSSIGIQVPREGMHFTPCGSRNWTVINVCTLKGTNFGAHCKSFLIKGSSSQGRFLGRRGRYAPYGKSLLSIRGYIHLLMDYKVGRKPKGVPAV